MKMTVQQIPEKGFYYHYKHNHAESVNNYAYEVVGVAMHTEERSYTVLYKPIYKNDFLEPADFCARPLDMFLENVEINGQIAPRFTKITDQGIIDELIKIKANLYNN